MGVSECLMRDLTKGARERNVDLAYWELMEVVQQDAFRRSLKKVIETFGKPETEVTETVMAMLVAFYRQPIMIISSSIQEPKHFVPAKLPVGSVPRYGDSQVTILMIHWEGQDGGRNHFDLVVELRIPPNPPMEPVLEPELPVNCPIEPMVTPIGRKRNQNDRKREESQRIHNSVDYIRIPFEFRRWTPEVRRNWFDTHPMGTLWTTGQKKLRKEARDDCMATIGSGSGSKLVALENELVAPPLVAPPSGGCMLTISQGPCIHSEALECELVEPAPVAQQSIERENPVSHSLKSPITLVQYQANHPTQSIVRESGANMIPISPLPLGFATEVSSSPEGQNIRRRITTSTPVAPLTCFGPINRPHPKTRILPVKTTTIIAEKLKPTVTGQKPTPVAAVLIKAAVPEREESYEEGMLKRYHEDR